MESQTVQLDPIALVRQLNPEEIREQLRVMENDRQALLILLRAATAAHRSNPKKQIGGCDAK
jgi:hypothetical protein